MFHVLNLYAPLLNLSFESELFRLNMDLFAHLVFVLTVLAHRFDLGIYLALSVCLISSGSTCLLESVWDRSHSHRGTLR